ncbi:MAG: CPBP family intramembrane metalloprotease [Puniceicoccaceae bacterium]|nr:MAG: CPBP family intramembrane metalloprotease [Puniceicoccaceae bacterium]
MENPLLILVAIVLVGYFFKLWLDDYRAMAAGNPNPRGLPGTTPAPRPLLVIGVVGALVLLAVEVAGEYGLEIVEEQSTVTWLFGFYTLFAAFAEELIFRGFLYVESKGRAVLWASAVGFSVLFALLHPFLWEWTGAEEGWVSFDFSLKAWFSTLMVFFSSLFFYWLRFSRLNPRQSLIPCVVAHLALNAGVFVTKLAQGFVEGLY